MGKKYKINLSGEKQSIKNIIETYMNDIDDKRIVLAIDDESVSAGVSVAKNGTVQRQLSKKAQKIL